MAGQRRARSHRGLGPLRNRAYLSLAAAVLLAGELVALTPPIAAAAVQVIASGSAPAAGLLQQVAEVDRIPLENQIGAGTTGLLRWVRTYIRRISKVVRHATRWWMEGIFGLIAFTVVTVLSAVLDREVLESWQRDGFSGLRRSLGLGAAVYVRLLLDGRTPLVGKLLLLFAVAYGVAGNDLLPDERSLRAYADDLLLVVLASRSFMRMCPDVVVEEQARAASFRRSRVEPS